ncbi:MAG TPA: putative quinol monooxygenase [Pyrinomonadaceae bacterium]|nr:putative quinol monooxygenase [Pyrinomonadaceae bacterium]
MNNNLTLVAKLKVKDDAVEQIKAAALAIVEPSRAEAGCISYDVHQSVEDPTVFAWYETWTDKAAIDQHFEYDYVKNFFATVNDLAAEPPTIVVSRKLT